MPSNDRSLVDIQAEIDQDTKDWFSEVDIDLGYLALALAGEAGEFANLIKKIIRDDLDINTKEFRVDMAFELVDVLIYTSMLANLLGVDLAEAYSYKREINVTRFGKQDPDVSDGGSGSGVVLEMPDSAGNGG